MKSTNVRFLSTALTALTLAGCATRAPAPVAVVVPPSVTTVALALPAGVHPGMKMPALLPDGSYATPNRALTGGAAVWHLRAGLNVAALACRGPDDAVLVARYNALLARQKSALAQAEAATAAEYRAAPATTSSAAWRGRYDDAMTSLYNYFSQGFAREAFCATAARVLEESAMVEPAAFPAFAQERLPLLDTAFTDVYRQYDAWKAQQAGGAVATPPAIVAAAMPVPIPARPAPTIALQQVAAVTPPRAPWIELGPVAALPDPSGRDVTAPSRVLASVQPTR